MRSLIYTKKFTSFCQVLKEMHIKENCSFFLPHSVYFPNRQIHWLQSQQILEFCILYSFFRRKLNICHVCLSSIAALIYLIIYLSGFTELHLFHFSYLSPKSVIQRWYTRHQENNWDESHWQDIYRMWTLFENNFCWLNCNLVGNVDCSLWWRPVTQAFITRTS